ncbi:MAG: chemotaxis protein CheB [Actinomycetota bacterium]|nr:chemotaxis protein CheB [Actinomycetota bacterium]
MTPIELVVVGGSWGGLDATCRLLSNTPAPVPVPVVLVLHRARTSDATMLAAVLRRCCGQRAVEADDKSPLEAGTVLVAPPDYHLLVEDGVVSLSTEAPVNYSRPSIDVAFDSAAQAYGAGLVAVLLTGTGSDGAEGIRHVKRRAGRTMVQDPVSAERGDMPGSALATGAVDDVGTPEELGGMLSTVLAPSGGKEG